MRYFFCIFILFSSLSYSAEKDFLVGAGLHPTNYTLEPKQLVNLLIKYNIKVIRYDYPWSQVEVKKGQYQPPIYKLDDLVNIASENGIKVILVLDYGNKFYGMGKPTNDAERIAFSKYAEWVAERYKDRDVIYEIWNEWPYSKDDRLGSPVSTQSALAYVELVKITSMAIRKVVPSAYIIAGSYNPLNNRFDHWGDAIVNAGIFDYINALSVHPYSYQSLKIANPDYGISVLDKLHDRFTKMHGKSVYFYITEFGFPDFKSKTNLTNLQRYDYITQYLDKIRSRNYINGFLWYDLINDGNDHNIMEHNFGLLDTKFNETENMIGFSSAIKSISPANDKELGVR